MHVPSFHFEESYQTRLTDCIEFCLANGAKKLNGLILGILKSWCMGKPARMTKHVKINKDNIYKYECTILSAIINKYSRTTTAQ